MLRRLIVFVCACLFASGLITVPATAQPSELHDCIIAARLAVQAAAAPVGDCLRGIEAPAAYRPAQRTTASAGAASAAAAPASQTATLCGPLPLYGSKGCPAAMAAVDAADNGNTIADENYALGWEGAYDVAVTRDGRVAVLTGSTTVDRHAEELDVLTVGVDVSSGEELWRAVHGNPEGGGDYPTTVLISKDGSTAYVSATTGLYRNDPPAMTVIAYDTATGDQRWTSSYEVGRPDTASYDFDAALSSDGTSLYVVGVTADVAGTMNSLVWALEPATGAQRWASEEHGPFDGWTLTSQIEVAPSDGTILVAGTTWDQDHRQADYWVRALTPGAEPRWQHRFDGGSVDQITGLAVSPDGSTVAAIGMSDNDPDITNYVQGGQNRDWATVTWDVASGEFGWHSRVTGLTAGDNRPFDVTFTADGTQIVVVGAVTTETAVGRAYGIRFYPVDTGVTSELPYYGGEVRGLQHPFNVATAVTAAPDGRIYITGYSSTLTPSNPLLASAGGGPVYMQNHPLDIATLAYTPDATGRHERTWVARWNPSAAFTDEALPAALAVAPGSGDLLVAGTWLYHLSPEWADPDDLATGNFFDLGLLRYTR